MNHQLKAGPAPYLAGSLLVIACFGAFLLRYALNVPYHDDIIDVLQFVLQFDVAESVGQRLDLLLDQYNDHRTAASRLAFYLVYAITGEVNFRTLSLLANLAVPAFVLLFFLSAESEQRRWPVMLLAALILAQPQAYGLLFWSMSAFAFYFVLLYALASLYCLKKGSWPALFFAIGFALASTLSLASGQLIWPVGLLLLVWQLLRYGERPWSHLLVWAVAALACLYLYYSGVPPRFQEVGLVDALLQTPLHHGAWYLVALGGALGFSEVAIALPAGGLLLLLALWLIARGIAGGFGVQHAFVLFLLGNAALVTIGRAPFSGLDYALAPRYSVASQLLLLACVVLLIQQLQSTQRVVSGVIIAAVMLCIVKYLFYTPLLLDHLDYRAGEFNKGKYQVIGYPVRETNGIVQQAIDRKMYSPPNRPLEVPGA